MRLTFERGRSGEAVGRLQSGQVVYHDREEGGEVMKPNWCGHRPPRPWFGVELEVEFHPKYSLGLLSSEVTRDLLLPCGCPAFDVGHDGSLEYGLEFRSLPATVEEHLSTVPWERFLDRLHGMACWSHDTTTCGLHVHVSREALPPAGWAKVAAFIVTHREKVEKVGRRKFNTYCRAFYKGYTLRAWEKVWERKYEAVNLSPADTVEFRFFRGTLSRSTLIASILFCDFAVRLAKRRAFHVLVDLPWSEVCRELVRMTRRHPHYLLLKEYMEFCRAWEEEVPACV